MTRPVRRFFVITPVLDGAQYLSAALASIDGQSCADWTHIVVDGGSTDGTLDIARNSILTEPRRRLIEGTDRGMYDGLFKGFDALTSIGVSDDDICLWLNADDYLAPWAFATMRLAFDTYDADWVTGQPAQWDAQGRLVLVELRAWYPRWFIAHGWFNIGCLGAIQQESTFFTHRLLRRLSSQSVAAIRDLRLAGDFLLWREFSRLSPLHAAPAVIGGFRLHGDNMSAQGAQAYRKELRALRALLLPRPLASCLRFAYRILAASIGVARARYPLTEKD